PVRHVGGHRGARHPAIPLPVRTAASPATRTPSTPPGMDTSSSARGVPAPDCLPVEELADCAREVLQRDGKSVLSYGPAGGYAPLREWIAERHGVTPDRVLLTN